MGRSIFSLTLAAAFSISAVTYAAAQPPREFLQEYPEPGENGALYLEFCWYGFLCEDHRAIAWGQVCDSSLAEEMAAGKSGEVEGVFRPLRVTSAGDAGKVGGCTIVRSTYSAAAISRTRATQTFNRKE